MTKTDYVLFSGRFMFIETSSPRRKGDIARLSSEVFSATKGSCMTFFITCMQMIQEEWAHSTFILRNKEIKETGDYCSRDLAIKEINGVKNRFFFYRINHFR